MQPGFLDHLRDTLGEIEAQGLLKRERQIVSPQSGRITVRGPGGEREMVKAWRRIGASFATPDDRGNVASLDVTTIALGYFPGADDGLWTMSPDGSNASPFLTGNVFQPTWQRLPNPVNPTTTVPSTSTTAANAAVVTPAFTG